MQKIMQDERSLGRSRQFLCRCCALLVVFAFGWTSCLAREGAEDAEMRPERIRQDFSNIRGLNYIASYAASNVAMWRFYDHDQIDRELGFIEGLGVNSVRVWLAWAVFDAERDQFIEKFSDFLSLCEKHHITVMPIIWDSCFGDKLAGYDDLEDWVPNPGPGRVADPEFRVKGDEFVRAVVKAGRDSPALLIWDVMNEPSGPSVGSWLKHYCRLVKSLDSEHPITIGWAVAASNRVSADWVDVLSYHPYGIFDANRKKWTDTIHDISKQNEGKPILATELGSPGIGQRYEDCLEFMEQERIGFYLFEAMVGTNRFRNVSGLFFPDGSIRELEPVQALQTLARREGVVADRVFPVRLAPLPYAKASPAEVASLFLHWEKRNWTKENAPNRNELLRWTLISLAWLGFLDGQVPRLQELRATVDEATKAGDLDHAEKTLAYMARKAGELLVKHQVVDNNRPFDDFSWMHGANYTPSYAATSVEFWLKYDPEVIDRELAYAQQIGLNCVRVFLQSLVYEHAPEQFLENFEHFLSIAERRGLKVMPILFDSCFGISPSLESQHVWVANPGPDRMSQGDFEALDGYVRAVVSQHVGDHRIALWDVMNEPSVTVLSLTEEGQAEIWSFVKHYCELVHKLDSTHAITIGSASDDNSHVRDWVDVLSCHSYAATKEEFRKRLSRTQEQANESGKPWIVSECCAPGWGSLYEMVMPELRQFDVGHTVWELVIGKNQFVSISGLFYPDGTVRRISSVEAVAGRCISRLTEKPDSKGVSIGRPGNERLAEYARFMARNEVTETTWRERNTAAFALLIRKVPAEDRKRGLEQLKSARAAYERGDKATAFNIVGKLLRHAAAILTDSIKSAPE